MEGDTQGHAAAPQHPVQRSPGEGREPKTDWRTTGQQLWSSECELRWRDACCMLSYAALETSCRDCVERHHEQASTSTSRDDDFAEIFRLGSTFSKQSSHEKKKSYILTRGLDALLVKRLFISNAKVCQWCSTLWWHYVLSFQKEKKNTTVKEIH